MSTDINSNNEQDLNFSNPLYGKLSCVAMKPTPKPRLSLLKKKQQPQALSTSPGIDESKEEDDYEKPSVLMSYPPPKIPPPPPPQSSSAVGLDGRQLDESDEFSDLAKHRISEKSESDESCGYGIVNSINRQDRTPTMSSDDGIYTNGPQLRSSSTSSICNSRDMLSSESSTPPPIPPRLREVSNSSDNDSNRSSSSFDLNKPQVQSESLNRDRSMRKPFSNTIGLERSNTAPPMRPSKNIPLAKLSPALMDLPSNKQNRAQTEMMIDGLGPIIPSQPTNLNGYLYKTGPERKGLMRRWCTLDTNSITYYAGDADMTCNPPKPTGNYKGVIYFKDFSMVNASVGVPIELRMKSKLPRSTSASCSQQSISSENSYTSHQMWYFEVAVREGKKGPKGRQFLFAAKCEEEGREWLQSIAHAYGPKSSYGIVCSQRVECCASVKIRLSISSPWLECFLIIAERHLHLIIYGTDNIEKILGDDAKNPELEETLEIDFRKITGVAFASSHQITPCPTVCEPIGQPIVINVADKHQGKTIYIQAQYRSHTETLHKLIVKDWKTPSNSELKDQYLTTDHIPVAIDKCIKFISTYDGLTTRGIYRVPGQMSIVKPLYDMLKSVNCDKSVLELQLRPEDGYTVHDVVSAMKMYLQSFDECVLTEKLLPRWMNNNNTNDRDSRLRAMKQLLSDLPTVNYCTLKYLIGHLNRYICFLVDRLNPQQ